MSEKTMISQRLGAGPAGPDAAPMPAGGEGIRALGAETGVCGG